MESDRTVYTRRVVNRLVKEEKVIKASEHWQDDRALPLPAQMFRMGAEMVAAKNAGFTYSLLSMWPVNKQNKPKMPEQFTPAVKTAWIETYQTLAGVMIGASEY